MDLAVPCPVFSPTKGQSHAFLDKVVIKINKVGVKKMIVTVVYIGMLPEIKVSPFLRSKGYFIKVKLGLLYHELKPISR